MSKKSSSNVSFEGCRHRFTNRSERKLPGFGAHHCLSCANCFLTIASTVRMRTKLALLCVAPILSIEGRQHTRGSFLTSQVKVSTSE